MTARSKVGILCGEIMIKKIKAKRIEKLVIYAVQNAPPQVVPREARLINYTVKIKKNKKKNRKNFIFYIKVILPHIKKKIKKNHTSNNRKILLGYSFEGLQY